MESPGFSQDGSVSMPLSTKNTSKEKKQKQLQVSTAGLAH